jgi:hypothetical protein
VQLIFAFSNGSEKVKFIVPSYLELKLPVPVRKTVAVSEIKPKSRYA